MTTQAVSVRHLATFDGERLLRNALFLTTCLLCWFTVAPFPDLSDPQLLAPKADGDLLGQVATVLLTGTLAVFVFVKRSSLVLRTVTLPLVLTSARSQYLRSCPRIRMWQAGE